MKIKNLNFLTLLTLLFSASFIFADEPSLQSTLTTKLPLFDGKTLDNFTYNPKVWTLQPDGTVKGETTTEIKIPKNTFMISKDQDIADFEATLSYKLTTANNSGVIYRAAQIEKPEWFRVKGYQIEGENNPLVGGFMYDEARRAWVASPGEFVIMKGFKEKNIVSQVNDHEILMKNKFVNDKEWNHLKIVARGNHFVHYINNELSVELIDLDPKDSSRTGAFCLQVHAGAPMTVFFKDVIVHKFNKKFGEAQTLFINDLSKWSVENVTTKETSFKCLDPRGLKMRGLKEDHTFSATQAIIANGKMSHPIPHKEGVVRFHVKGKAAGEIAGTAFSTDKGGNADGFSVVEVLISNNKAELSINGKIISQSAVKNNDISISSSEAIVRNVIFIPFAE